MLRLPHVTGKRQKDLHSLDRSDLGGNTRRVRLGLRPSTRSYPHRERAGACDILTAPLVQ